MDSDDIRASKRLKQINYLETHSDVDFIDPKYIIDDWNNIISIRRASNNRFSVNDVVKRGIYIQQ